MTKLTALFSICLITSSTWAIEPISFSINTKKWSHVLDDHFISITVNPTDLLQGKVYGLAMNSTLSILKGLAPAYVRIGSADSAKYTFKRSRYPNDMVKPEDEFTVTETHWMVFNEVARSAGLDVIVCLNPAHRIEGTKKWDTRNSLELISFSDSQGYNLTWQLGYEVQAGEELSGNQFGKDFNRLRTILNAFPRYQHSKLIGPDIRVIHKKEDIDFWNDMLLEAGPTLDAVTWHPRWPQPSKMKVSDNSDLGYEFPTDYFEWDRVQLNKILQRSIFKNPVWIGETKTESTGTFAEGLIWARRLVLAAKFGIEVVMKQPNLMDVTHPKPEYWIALLHKRLLGKSVLETKSVTNSTDLAVIAHCTNPSFWSDKPEKLQDGPVTVFGVNMGGLEQKIQMKGTWSGKSQLLFQYVLTSGSDPDAVFSQMTYLNGEPILMTDDGMLPDIVPKIKKVERGLIMKLPPYSIGFWVIPEAKVKICQVQPHNIPSIKFQTLTLPNSLKTPPTNLQNIKDINQFLVDKLTNPVSESEETPEVKIEPASSESSEKDLNLLAKESNMPRVARRIRQVIGLDEINHELKTLMQETQDLLSKPEGMHNLNVQMKHPKAHPSLEHRIQTIAEGISDAIKTTNQEHEFDKFLQDAGLKHDFGALMMNDRRHNAPGMVNHQIHPHHQAFAGVDMTGKRLKRSVVESDEYSREESGEEEFEEEEVQTPFSKKLTLKDEEENEKKDRKQDFFIPHNPDLKGLEEKYKLVLQSKIKDGKRKMDNLKKKIKQEEAQSHKVKPPETVSDIQEEILKKEIKLLEKTEETVADILTNQKKRQENFEDLIFDELNDVKEERIIALEEMKNKKNNAIVKRHTPTPLPKPILKTVDYLEKNFNLEPQSVKKIKRSLEEKMGELLRSHDVKRSSEVKKRLASQKEEKRTAKEPHRAEEWEEDEVHIKNSHSGRDERNDNTSNKDRARDKNFARKVMTNSPKYHHSSRGMRKPDTGRDTSREAAYRKNDEMRKVEDVDDSFEFFNEMKPIDITVKSDRKRFFGGNYEEKAAKYSKKDSKDLSQEERGSKYVKKDSKDAEQKEKSTRYVKKDSRNSDQEEKSSKYVKKDSRDSDQEEKSSRYVKKESRDSDQEEKGVRHVKKDTRNVEQEASASKYVKKDSRYDADQHERGSKYLRKNSESTDEQSSKHSRLTDTSEKAPRYAKKDSRDFKSAHEEHPMKYEVAKKPQVVEEESKEMPETIKSEEKETKIEAQEDKIPLKNDKERRLNMLKQISSMVDGINSMENNSDRWKRMNDEDLSVEFDTDIKKLKTRKIKRRARKAEVSEFQFVAPPVESQVESDVEEVAKIEVPPTSSTTITPMTSAPITTTTTAAPTTVKQARQRKHRVRPSRQRKINVNANEEESQQKKRHLSNLARPLLDLEKKKLLKPKLRKLHPKIFRVGNELPLNEKEKNMDDTKSLLKESEIPKETSETEITAKEISKPEVVAKEVSEPEIIAKAVSEPEMTPAQVPGEKVDLAKDLQEIVEHKHFLGQESDSLNKESETLQSDLPKGKEETEMNFSGETPEPTEGYIIVEPTIEYNVESTDTATEKIEENVSETSSENKYKNKDKKMPESKTSESDQSEAGRSKSGEPEFFKSESEEHELEDNKTEQSKDNKNKELESEEHVSEKSEKPETEKSTLKEEANEKNSDQKTKDKMSETTKLEDEAKNEESSEVEDNSNERKDFFSSGESSSVEDITPIKGRKTKMIESPMSVELLKEDDEDKSEATKANSSQRKRRATFLPNHGEERDEDDYSSEERIKKFKQMIYKTSPAKKLTRNEVRSPVGGMGADEFLRMAGSTVRVMFDDVIPEAYGQTKTKIQNMGISEYIKEFGKIVQQMKNLDKIFFNIGEAAVKGYIRGNRAEKGPYIQVISRKKRSLSDEDVQTEESTEPEVRKTMSTIENVNAEKEIMQVPLGIATSTTQMPSSNHQLMQKRDDEDKAKEDGREYARTITGETFPNRWGLKGSVRPAGLWSSAGRQTEKEDSTAETIAQAPERVLTDRERTEPQDNHELGKSSSFSEYKSDGNYHNALQNKMAKAEKYLRKSERMNPDGHYVNGAIQDDITPWIKTTKDFIQQAFTTLQRQRELSEILARESDMIKIDDEKKALGKRETGMDEPMLPVYHLTNSQPNRKREANSKLTDEGLIRHLKGLQPGVYVVPSEEMTNVRSEQITNEPRKKSGLPNVVTLNIYYDKKNQETSAKIDETGENAEPRISQDVVTYYQNKAWNAAAGQYDQNNQFVSPVGIQEMNLGTPIMTPALQAGPVFTTEPRLGDLPNSRLIQYPTSTFHYPPNPKLYPSIVPRSSQSLYAPVYYVQPENRFVPQPPGTKRQWYEFKARNPGAPVGTNAGWNIQYETVPTSLKGHSKSSYNKNFRLYSDKKRSIGDEKMSSDWSETALPFWKFFSTSSAEKTSENEEKVKKNKQKEKEVVVKEEKEKAEDSKENRGSESAENDNSDEIFEEIRKRAKQAVEKKSKISSDEEITTEKSKGESKTRKRRSVIEETKSPLPVGMKVRKLVKRSYPYHAEFRDHDVLPEWFGTYQEIDNTLDDLPPHIRRSHIISTPWSNENEEILSILNADDELSLVDLDNDDYYFGNDIGQLRRYRRKTDENESAMLKTNMIFKAPVIPTNDNFKQKTTAMAAMKKLSDEDSSLEGMMKPKLTQNKMTLPETLLSGIKSSVQQEPSVPKLQYGTPMKFQNSQQHLTMQLTTQHPQLTQQPNQQHLTLQQPNQKPQNDTKSLLKEVLLPRNPNDDTFYYFFKYAYDSLVKVMKSMTELF